MTQTPRATTRPALEVLPLGSIVPRGWLLRQLERQASGTAGRLGKFWPDIRDSAWIGGAADGWERGPYWLDAMVPLAFTTGDERLLATVHHWVDEVLSRQAENGWFGPTTADPDGAHHAGFGELDVWPRTILLKALLQYASATGDPRILPAVLRQLRRIGEVVATAPLHEWGRARWADLAFVILEVERATSEGWLLDLAATIRRQGLAWVELADDFPHTSRVGVATLRDWQAESDGVWMNDRFLQTHGVNVAMGLKSIPAAHLMGDDHADAALLRTLLTSLDRHHGQPTGVFSCDEHLAGRHPSQGTETCAVVELMYSLEVALETWGFDEELVQRLERVAFNALPAASLPDDSAHQYDQQANQIAVGDVPDPIYTNNGPDANAFGLEPHFGCCTANRHQGWPKFAARLWMRSREGGLAALSYAPCTVTTDVRGASVTLTVDSGYPFGDEVAITVASDRPVEFPLQLRMPGWASTVEVVVGDDPVPGARPDTLLQLDRRWTGETTIRLRWTVEPTAERGWRDTVSLHRGPLVLSAALVGDWQPVNEAHGVATWHAVATDPWNYAIAAPFPKPSLADLVLHPDSPNPFDPRNPGITAHVQAQLVDRWVVERGAAGEPPPSPVSVNGLGQGPSGLALQGYGSARLRITQFPWFEGLGKG